MTQKPLQHLTATDVVAAARQAYLNGTLLASHGREAAINYGADRYEGGPVCAYAIGPYRCAIGAVLNDAVLLAISAADNEEELQTSTAFQLAETFKLITIEPSDSYFIQRFQTLHDDWLHNEYTTKRLSSGDYATARDEFLSIIGVQP